jgi:hypothetical protein
MIIFANNIVVLPLLIGIWLTDIYIFMTIIRIMLIYLGSPRTEFVQHFVQTFVDPLPRTIGQMLVRRRDCTIPSWMSWTVAILVVVTVRYILTWLAVQAL